MHVPTLRAVEAQTHDTFSALMWSLAHPGRKHSGVNSDRSTHESLLAIGECLLDLETSFFTPDDALEQALLRTTARLGSAETADYHFYPSLDNLTHLKFAKVGDMLYPDRAATLAIGCTIGHGTTLRLTGPGIADSETITVGSLPEELWQERKRRSSYPLGWDIFLVDGNQIIGLPRTTSIQQLG